MNDPITDPAVLALNDRTIKLLQAQAHLILVRSDSNPDEKLLHINAAVSQLRLVIEDLLAELRKGGK